MTDLGIVIRKFRQLSDTTLYTMAKQIDMGTAELSGIECGRMQPTPEQLTKIAAYLAGKPYKEVLVKDRANKEFWDNLINNPAMLDDGGNSWISVKKQLPKQGVDVFIYVPSFDNGKGLIDLAWLDDGSNGVLCFVGTEMGFDIDDVSHWQPLPKFPEETSLQSSGKKAEINFYVGGQYE